MGSYPATMKVGDGGALGIAAITYVAVDYLRDISPTWHTRLQLLLWSLFLLLAIPYILSYKHWSSELRSVIPFVLSVAFLLCTFLFEVLPDGFVPPVFNLDSQRKSGHLPDTRQWLLLALDEKLPQIAVDIIRAHVIELHRYLMLIVMLGFSVLFHSVKSPALGLGARYLFTMAIGRLQHVITFVSTIHSWAKKYHVLFASDPNAREVLHQYIAHADVGNGYSEGTGWYPLLKEAGGGRNELISDSMLAAVFTAMAWTEAYGGCSSGIIWVLLLHSAYDHSGLDCIATIYVGILLWKMTGFLWSANRKTNEERLQALLSKGLTRFNNPLLSYLLKQVRMGRQHEIFRDPRKYFWMIPYVTNSSTLTLAILAFVTGKFLLKIGLLLVVSFVLLCSFEGCIQLDL